MKFLSLAFAALITTASSAMAQMAAGDPPTVNYERFGKGQYRLGVRGCVMPRRWYNFDTCEGYPRGQTFGSASNAASLSQWVGTRRWHATPDTAMVAIAPPTQPSIDFVQRIVQSIYEPGDLRLDNYPTNGLVLAKIEGDPNGLLDRRYNIGKGATDGFERTFFVVVDSVSLSDTGMGVSRPVARWHVYGVKDGKVLATGKSGTVRWCGVSHSKAVRDAGATFLSCDKVGKFGHLLKNNPSLARVRGHSMLSSLRASTTADGPGSLSRDQVKTWATANKVRIDDTQIDIIIEVYNDSFTAPLWTPCGVGCCTAEEL